MVIKLVQRGQGRVIRVFWVSYLVIRVIRVIESVLR
jgi:hypothetical protein